MSSMLDCHTPHLCAQSFWICQVCLAWLFRLDAHMLCAPSPMVTYRGGHSADIQQACASWWLAERALRVVEYVCVKHVAVFASGISGCWLPCTAKCESGLHHCIKGTAGIELLAPGS